MIEHFSQLQHSTTKGKEAQATRWKMQGQCGAGAKKVSLTASCCSQPTDISALPNAFYSGKIYDTSKRQKEGRDWWGSREGESEGRMLQLTWRYEYVMQIGCRNGLLFSYSHTNLSSSHWWNWWTWWNSRAEKGESYVYPSPLFVYLCTQSNKCCPVVSSKILSVGLSNENQTWLFLTLCFSEIPVPGKTTSSQMEGVYFRQ